MEAAPAKTAVTRRRGTLLTKTRVIVAATVALLAIGGAAAFAAYGGCAWFTARTAQAPPEAPVTGDVPFRVVEVVGGLESPWAIAFLPDGRILVTERPGRLRLIEDGKLRDEPVAGVPEVAYRGQGGLLDIALHPRFAENRWLYLSYSASEGRESFARVTRFVWNDDRGLTDPTVILDRGPVSRDPAHYGTRIAFDRAGKLYVTLGERHEQPKAQDLGTLHGTTLRLNDDGTVPDDNPFVDREGARPEIYSYGHRNAQGMALHPTLGVLYQTEHGPTGYDAPPGGDEINRLVAGGNYGWPVIHHRMERDGMISPMAEYTPANAPSGCTFVTGDAFPQWRNNFFFATLVGQGLYRLVFDDAGERVVGQEILLHRQYGRLRDVRCAPDGTLYVLTSNTDAYGRERGQRTDRLLRLVPEVTEAPAEPDDEAEADD